METTLDSIRPSVIDGDASYLYGRDPSILAFSQRPLPSSKQNLLTRYEDEEADHSDPTGLTTSDSGLSQTVKVYLRLKPIPRTIKLTKEETDAYCIVNSTILLTKLPSLDHTMGSLKAHKTNEPVCRKFTFTQTFGPETTQLKLFEDVIQQRMVDFLAGQNCTVMTYGTTNSGKSYTLQGTTTSPGIIPRGLEFVFSNVNPRPMPCYKPIHGNSIVCLNSIERAQEIEAKNKLLTFASIDKHQYTNAYKQMQKLLQEELPIRPSESCDAHYSVWVSFAEIYNESIYDLLSNECGKRRTLLKLAADGQDRAFIRGLKTVCVNSGSEAYQVLMAGQYNLKVAATALNARSSRSHCIFTIQLLKYYAENEPDSVEISTFTFCDLAGSERLKKTLNVGDRLKEAQNINTSLLVLGRCLKSIYEGQSMNKRQEHVGPFRESKLTRLFQRALSGKEQIALIVNVNPLPNLYVETQNVLNFSAIAKKIVIEPKKIHRRVANSRFSQMVAQSVMSNTDWDPSDLRPVVATSDATESENAFVSLDDYEDLLEENRSLKNEIGALKASMLNKDLQIRQELTDTYTGMMKDLEVDWKNRIRDVEEQTENHFEWRINMVEAFYKEKLNELSSRKRRRTSDSGSDDDRKSIRELEIENSRLEAKIHSLKKSLKHFREKNETLVSEKNKYTFELGLAQEELKSLKELLSTAQDALCKDEDSVAYIEGLRKQLNTKQEYVKELKEFLNEAKEEYIEISAHAERMENRLKAHEESLAEATEYITDLQSLLDSTNACLEEKTKAIDVLEEKLRSFEEKSNASLKFEEKHPEIQGQLEETIRQLKEKIDAMEKSALASETVAPNSNDPETKIAKEVPSGTEDGVPTAVIKPHVSDGAFIKTESGGIFEIPSLRHGDSRESEEFVQVEEIALQENANAMADEKVLRIEAKLHHTENENESLKNKLSHSDEEIQSLKESLHTTKEHLNDITNKLQELKDAQNRESEARTRDLLLQEKAQERRVSLRDCEIQTAEIKIVEASNQTDIIVDLDKSMQTSFIAPFEEDKSVQTMAVETEESKIKEELLVDLERKCADLEKDCSEKQLSISIQADKIADLEGTFAKRAKEQAEKIAELNKCVERFELENKQLEERMNNYSKEVEQLKQRLQQADQRDEEKNTEINMLQQSYKAQLVEDARDKKIHDELKNTLKELLDTKEALARTDELYQRLRARSKQEIESLEARISSMEKNSKIQNMSLPERVEAEKVKNERDGLRAIVSEKEREMQSLVTNRDTMIKQYETLVKSLQDDCERGKKEISRFQELFRRMPATPQGKENKRTDENSEDQAPLANLADSEIRKISRHRAPLAPPPAETKRSTRKKKLYTPVNEYGVDVEVSEADPPAPTSPSACIRRLRNRKH